MEVIVILISISVLIAAGFLSAFIWAVKSGQFEDTYTPSVRILFDKKETKKEKNIKKEHSENRSVDS